MESLVQLILAAQLGSLYINSDEDTAVPASGVSPRTIRVNANSYGLVVYRITFGSVVPGQFTVDITGRSIRSSRIALNTDVIRDGIPAWMYVEPNAPLQMLVNNTIAAVGAYQATIYGLDVSTPEEWLKVKELVSRFTGLGGRVGESTNQMQERVQIDQAKFPTRLPTTAPYTPTPQLIRLSSPFNPTQNGVVAPTPPAQTVVADAEPDPDDELDEGPEANNVFR